MKSNNFPMPSIAAVAISLLSLSPSYYLLTNKHSEYKEEEKHTCMRCSIKPEFTTCWQVASSNLMSLDSAVVAGTINLLNFSEVGAIPLTRLIKGSTPPAATTFGRMVL